MHTTSKHYPICLLHFLPNRAPGSWRSVRRRGAGKVSTSTNIRSGATAVVARANDLLHHGVEAGAMGTLDAQKVPVAILAARLAVVAHDVDDAGQIGGHGLHLDVPRAGGPRGRHGLLADDGLLAYGAAVVEAGELAEAVGVDGVAAGQVLGRLAGGEHVFAAHGTVVLVLVLHAVVIVVDVDRDAHAAPVAVAERFATADAAEAAVFAVERPLALDHPQVADVAVVLSELDGAVGIDAAVGRRLARLAVLANDLADGEAVHGAVARRRGHLVVADAAAEDLVAARGDDVAPPLVVDARDGLAVCLFVCLAWRDWEMVGRSLGNKS